MYIFISQFRQTPVQLLLV